MIVGTMLPAVVLCSSGCSSVAPTGDGERVYPSVAAKEPAAPAPVVPVTPSNAGDIDQLVGSAGRLSTDATPDLEPVKIGTKPASTVTDERGASFTCAQTNYRLTKIPEKFVALNPNADVLWPGSLVQGKSMASGILDPIPVKRAPGTITLALASGGAASLFQELNEPSLSSAIQAQNDILSLYSGATPAKFSYSYTSAHSASQIAVAVEANVTGGSWTAGATLSINTSDEKSRFLIQFTQEYFTMAFNPPEGASGVFAPEVTAEKLKPYVSNGNPPVYVSAVTYGRIFYIMFESKVSKAELEASVRGSFGGAATGSASVKWKNVINESTVKAYGLGGNAEVAISAVTGTDQFEKVSKFLSTGANFDKSSPGVPISYSLRHLADASQVRLALTTEYTVRDCQPVASGCDGTMGSTKVVDECGVCGGDGSTCKACPAESLQSWGTNGAYVSFNVGAGLHGANVTFPDGHFSKWATLSCNGISWGNVLFSCSAGHWYFTRGSLNESSGCGANKNEAWSNGTHSITTGYAKH